MRKIKKLLFGVLFVAFLLLSAFLGYCLTYRDLILPNILISEIEVGGLSEEHAKIKVQNVFENNQNKIVFVDLDNKEIGSLEGMSVDRDFGWVAKQAVKIGRTGNLAVDLRDRVELLYKKKILVVPLSFKEEDLDEYLDVLSIDVDKEPVFPIITKVDGKYSLLKGVSGQSINRPTIKKEIIEKLSIPGSQRVSTPIDVFNMKEDEGLVKKALDKLDFLAEGTMEVKYREFILNLDSDRVAYLYNLVKEGLNPEEFKLLVEEIAEKIETEPRDAIFEFENGRVNEFKPEVVGVKVDLPKLESELKNILFQREGRSLEVPVILSYPKIKAGEINNLGIKELIAVGKSSFDHSIPGRIFNVALASSRINGVVVAPGEEFSFNKAVGEINRQTGYQSAYVISEGKTVLGDGGGVCQVSTTVFRAAMNFGFPITERRSHAYRVGYYEQDSPPGLDATIYSPTTDFKFLNDTNNHILIQAKVDKTNLTMHVEIYGTSDGRKSTLSKPIVSGQISAPATSYVDDPSLPKGITKQIDWAASGAKVVFDYKVERNGERLFEKRFVSNYQPWRAVYLVGTGQ